MKGKQRHVTIGQRITLAMVIFVTCIFAAVGTLVFLVEHRAIQIEVDDGLRRTADELRVFADGVHPTTGEQFTDVSSLLESFLGRTVIGPNEGEVGVVDGVVSWVSDDVVDAGLRPELDDQLMAELLPLSTSARISMGAVTTDQGRYRYLVAPIYFPDSTGALIHVFDMHREEAQLRQTIAIYAVVAVGALMIASLASLVLVRRLLHPVEQLRVAAESIDEQELSARVPVRGRDDLTRLSVSINRMLDRVQNSIEGQQQLLDDVGHELRTPITILRGHLELMDPQNPEDVANTRDLSIDELDRMSSLVEDLITLARSRESDFLSPKWVSLATLTDQTLEKARGLGDRSWRLERIVSTDAWLDPQRITQAWLQLCANAVKYSTPGSAITLASELVRGEVRLMVRDQGIGIASNEVSTIRERFVRGTGVARIDGAGLGLSIVETIVMAHGGRLDIESEKGVGSTFTIVVPLSPPREES